MAAPTTDGPGGEPFWVASAVGGVVTGLGFSEVLQYSAVEVTRINGTGPALTKRARARQAMGVLRGPACNGFDLGLIILDASHITADIVEISLKGSPYGTKGAEELLIISNGPAIMNAKRTAARLKSTRIPFRHNDIQDPAGKAVR